MNTDIGQTTQTGGKRRMKCTHCEKGKVAPGETTQYQMIHGKMTKVLPCGSCGRVHTQSGQGVRHEHGHDLFWHHKSKSYSHEPTRQ